jgi:hypothetical protein
VRYVYDPAKTPLQRLLLSGVLTAEIQQELTKVAQALDPIRLLHQLEQLQQAVFRCAVGCAPVISPIPSAPIRVFSVQDCTEGTLPAHCLTGNLTAPNQLRVSMPHNGASESGWDIFWFNSI